MSIKSSPQERYLTLEQHRELYARCNGLPPRSLELAVAIFNFARDHGMEHKKARLAWSCQMRREYRWSPAEMAYVRGEVERVEDWREPEPVVSSVASTSTNEFTRPLLPSDAYDGLVGQRLTAIEARLDTVIAMLRQWE